MDELPSELKLRIGKWFEATAKGKFAIAVLAFALFGVLAGQALEFW